MGLKAQHPGYSEYLSDWQQMRDTYEGERKVKKRDDGGFNFSGNASTGQAGIAFKYLPPTDGMVQDGMNWNADGWRRYQAYKARAVFHDFVSDAVEGMIGVMHRKEAVIEVPTQMAPMLESITIHGETAGQLLRKINTEQLVTGRLGLLVDFEEEPDQATPMAYISMYPAETVINWNDGLIVLDEDTQVQDPKTFEWKAQEQVRVLAMMNPEGEIQSTAEDDDADDADDDPNTTYHQHLFIRAPGGTFEFDGTLMEEPTYRGQAAEEIPFTFVNSKDLLPNPDNPPLLGLSNLALAIYRGEADYRQNLFMQGQETLVIKGGMDEDDETRTGSGATIHVGPEGDAKYIGVSAAGLAEQRQALENDKKAAAAKAGQLTDTTARSKESGDALKVRIAAQTASMIQVALAGAGALEDQLKKAARWMNLDDSNISVVPNLDFADDKLLGEELVKLITAKTMGAPISMATIHKIMKQRELTELDLEEELELISNEEPLITSDEGVEEEIDDEDQDDET